MLLERSFVKTLSTSQVKSENKCLAFFGKDLTRARAPFCNSPCIERPQKQQAQKSSEGAFIPAAYCFP